MKKFEEQRFNIPALKGISAKNIEEHLKLYAGYVKNANSILDLLAKYHTEDMPGNSYIIGELHRRFSFEYNGIRNHEMYFSALETACKRRCF
jgi:Fe-Mn family superoxide dismutase